MKRDKLGTSKLKKMCSTVLSAWLIISLMLSAIPVYAGTAVEELEIGVRVDQVYDADVVLALGQSGQDVSTFKEDLNAELVARGLSPQRIRIDSVEAQEVNILEGRFKMNLKWPHTGDDMDSHVEFWNDTSMKAELYYGNKKVYGSTLDYDDTVGGTGEWVTLDFDNIPEDITTLKVYINPYSGNTNATMYLYKEVEGVDQLLIESTEFVNQKVKFGEFRRNDGSWDFHYNDGTVFSGREVKVVSRDFMEVIREPDWRSSARHFLVNLNDETLDDLDDDAALGEIITRMDQEQLHYIGWGLDTDGQGTVDATQNQADTFIGRNANRGTFVNRHGQDYAQQINQIADYIVSNLTGVSDAEVLTLGNAYELSVMPESEKTNTIDEFWPEGKWRILHDPAVYENHQGTVPYSGHYLDDLNVSFDKVGKYEIYYKDRLVKTLYVHRQPMSLFTLHVDEDGHASYEDFSYDLDAQSHTDGILEREWRWKRTTDSEWTNGQPSTFAENGDYIVQLVVRDHQGAWSASRSRYQTTQAAASKPIAEFQLTWTPLTWPESTIEVWDLSYDPKNKAIASREWKVYQNDEEIYAGNEPLKDFSEFGPGEYKLSLRVQNEDLTWSEWFSRYLTIDPNTAPTISDVPRQYVYSGHEQRTVIQVGDAESTAFGVTVTAESSDPELLPETGIAVTGEGPNRTVTFKASPDMEGEAVITLTASDGDLTRQTAFTVEVANLDETENTGFVETEANDGTVTGIQRIAVMGATLKDTLDASHIRINNLPAGLGFIATRISDTKLDIQLIGAAINHSKEFSTDRLSVTVGKENLIGASSDQTTRSFSVNFKDPAVLSVNKSVVTESVYGSGQFTDTIELSISNGKFATVIKAEDIAVNQLPAGLNATVSRISDTVLEIGFTGTATVTEDVYDASIVLFAENVIGSSHDLTTNTFKINFWDQEPLLVVQTPALYESNNNDGTIDDKLVLRLVNGAFDETVAESVYSGIGWPDGLYIGGITLDDSSQITVSVAGQALSHEATDSVDHAQVLIGDIQSNTFSMLFRSPPPSIATSPDTIRDAGNGFVTDTMTITAANGTFSEDVASGVIVNNLPDGLGYTVSRISDTEVNIQFTGQATKKNEASRFASVTIDAGFISGASSPITSNSFNLEAPEDATLVYLDLTQLTWEIIKENNISQASVTSNVGLLTKGTYGSDIVWTSSDESVISVDGTVTRPEYEEGDREVTLTAVIQYGAATETKQFILHVKKWVATDEQAVAEDKANLTWNMIREANLSQDSVDSNLNLSGSGEFGSEIIWTSTDESVIGTDGTVTRPGFLTGNRTVTLTATLTKGEAIETKTFVLTIIKQPITDGESVSETAAGLTWDIIRADNEEQDEVATALNLIGAGSFDSEIVWTSSDETVIGTDGTVKRSSFLTGDRTVTLTATITKGEAVETKTFVLTVVKLPITDEESVSETAAGLTWDTIRADNEEQAEVTTALNLIDAGSYDSEIAWTSSDESVIGTDGTVKRSSFLTGDRTVTLTAAITKGEAVETKTFVLTVVKLPITDEESVSETANALTWDTIREDNEDEDEVTTALNLNAAGGYDSEIVWTSSDESIIGTDGTVTRPSFLTGDRTVTLTASISKGEVVETKTFVLTIAKLPITDEESVSETANALTWDAIRIDNEIQEEVRTGLNLNTGGSYDSKITWTSSDESVIGTDGTVTRPENADGDHEVTLTAAITKGDVTVTKEFVFIVKAKLIDVNKQLDEAIDQLRIGYAEHDSADNVTQNISLISTGFYNSEVKWISHREDIISENGMVQRPLKDTVVRLTASVTKDGYFRKKDFYLTVKGAGIVDLPQDELQVEIGYGPGDSADSIKKNLFLTKSGKTGSEITWTSNHPEVITDTGRVNRPGPDDEDVTVVITAVLRDPDNPADTLTKTFTVIIKKLSDQEAVDDAARSLKIDDAATFATGDIWESVTEGFLLLQQGKYNTDITWESNMPSVIHIDQDESEAKGSVIRQRAEKHVILTATFTRNGKTASKKYLLIVKALGVTKDGGIRQATSRQAEIKANLNGNVLQQNVTILRTNMSDGTKIDTIIVDEDVIYDLVESIDPYDPDAVNRSVTIMHVDDPIAHADEIAVEIPATAVSIIAGRDTSLDIISGLASIHLDEAALKQIEALGMDLYFRIVPVQSLEERQQLQSNAMRIGSAKLALGSNKTINPLGMPRRIETNYYGVDTIIWLPLSDFAAQIPADSSAARDAFLDSLRVYVEHSDGEVTVYSPLQIVYSNGGDPEAIEFQIDKFSSFQIVRIADKPASGFIGGIVPVDNSKLTVTELKKRQEQGKNIEITTDEGTIILPAAELDLEQIMALFDRQDVDPDVLYIEIDMKKANQSLIDEFKKAAARKPMETIGEPVQISIEAVYGDQIRKIAFKGMAQYKLPIPDGMKITTGVLYKDGSLYHQPTYITVENGRYYAVINSFETGVFGLIWNPEQFADVENHWSKKDVNDMGSRLVVNGINETTYEPKRAITRAEFTAIIVRALGIVSHVEADSSFSDVPAGAWYEEVLAVAIENGLITGYQDGTFRPNNNISRQEAMVIVSRAMAFTKLEASFSPEQYSELLQTFADADSIADWADSAVRMNLATGIILGKDGRLALKENITRAETSAVARRLLIQSGLINP